MMIAFLLLLLIALSTCMFLSPRLTLSERYLHSCGPHTNDSCLAPPSEVEFTVEDVVTSDSNVAVLSEPQ
eukprot:4584042-Amphidinium_carterae.1